MKKITKVPCMANGGKVQTGKKRDYSKSREVAGTPEEFVAKNPGYIIEKDDNGITHAVKASEAKINRKPKTSSTPAPKTTIATSKKSTNVPKSTKTLPYKGQSASEDIVHFKTTVQPKPEPVALNLDQQMDRDKKLVPSSHPELVTYQYPDYKGGGGWGSPITRNFHKTGTDPNKYPEISQEGMNTAIKTGSFSPEHYVPNSYVNSGVNMGTEKLGVAGLNKNTFDVQKANTLNPIEQSGTKQITGTNFTQPDKSAQIIGVGLQAGTAEEIAKKKALEDAGSLAKTTNPDDMAMGGLVGMAKMKKKKIQYLAGGGSVLDENGNTLDENGNIIKYATGGDQDAQGNKIDANGAPIDNQQAKAKGSGMASIGKGVAGIGGWMGYATAASEYTENNLVGGPTITNNKTGEVVKNTDANENDQRLSFIADPLHKKLGRDLKAGRTDYAVKDTAGVATLGISNAILQKTNPNDEYFHQKENAFNAAKASNAQGTAMDRRNSGKTGTDMASGGKIVGKGGPTDDEVETKLEPGGFVVPAVNAEKAEAIRVKYFGDKSDKKAELKEGTKKVNASDGEHYFTKKEVEYLNSKGVNLNALAPNAKTKISKVPGMKSGGYVSPEEKKAREEAETIAKNKPKDLKHLKNLQEEKSQLEGKKGTESRIRDINSEVATIKRRHKIVDEDNFEPATKTGAELNAYSGITSNNKKSSTPKSSKTTEPTTKKSDNFRESPSVDVVKKDENQARFDTEFAKMNKESADQSAANQKANEDGYNSELGVASVAKNNPWYKDINVGGLLETGASAAQVGLGLSQLYKDGKRPENIIDPEFDAQVEKAKANAQFGFSDEQKFLNSQNSQNLLNDATLNVKKLGLNNVEGIVMTRAAINDKYKRDLETSIQDAQLKSAKNDKATELIAQRAAMKNALFQNKLDAWKSKQTAGSNLVQAGIGNFIGSLRMQKELDAQDKASNIINNAGAING